MERIHMLMDQRLNIVKISVLSTLIYRLNTTPIKIETILSAEMEIPVLKLLWNEWQGTPHCKTILKKQKEQSWEAHTFCFQNILQSYSNQNCV